MYIFYNIACVIVFLFADSRRGIDGKLLLFYSAPYNIQHHFYFTAADACCTPLCSTLWYSVAALPPNNKTNVYKMDQRKPTAELRRAGLGWKELFDPRAVYLGFLAALDKQGQKPLETRQNIHNMHHT